MGVNKCSKCGRFLLQTQKSVKRQHRSSHQSAEQSGSAYTACYSPITTTEIEKDPFFFRPLMLCRYDQLSQRSQEASCNKNEAKLQCHCSWLQNHTLAELRLFTFPSSGNQLHLKCYKDLLSSAYFPCIISTKPIKTRSPTADCSWESLPLQASPQPWTSLSSNISGAMTCFNFLLTGVLNVFFWGK